jgi:hypothetical protein
VGLVLLPTSVWTANGGAAILFLVVVLVFLLTGKRLKSRFWYLMGRCSVVLALLTSI